MWLVALRNKQKQEYEQEKSIKWVISAAAGTHSIRWVLGSVWDASEKPGPAREAQEADENAHPGYYSSANPFSQGDAVQ